MTTMKVELHMVIVMLIMLFIHGGHEGGHDDHHESGQHDGLDFGTNRDLEQAFAEFGSWFCQKKTRSLAKVTTLGSYSTCAGLDINTVCIKNVE